MDRLRGAGPRAEAGNVAADAVHLGDALTTTDAVLGTTAFWSALGKPKLIIALKITCRSMAGLAPMNSGRDDWSSFGLQAMTAKGIQQFIACRAAPQVLVRLRSRSCDWLFSCAGKVRDNPHPAIRFQLRTLCTRSRAADVLARRAVQAHSTPCGPCGQ